MSKFQDLSGQKFGKLTVVKRAEDYVDHNGYHRPRWLCLCECGNEVIVHACHLKSGATTSCGCFKKERTSTRNKTHGLRNTRLYNIWIDMKARCYNPNKKEYKHYGARNITVCKEWKDNYQNFYDWSMNNGYSDKAKRGESTIDRIDVNKGYSPDNCRWVNMKTQQRNKRNNKLITINGETHCLSEWCEMLNLKYRKVSDRINKLHWSIETALTKR